MGIAVAEIGSGGRDGTHHGSIAGSAGAVCGGHALRTMNMACLTQLIVPIVIGARLARATCPRYKPNSRVAGQAVRTKGPRAGLA